METDLGDLGHDTWHMLLACAPRSVLGQHEGKLKCIHGAPHTELTALICRAHSLVYTAVHLTPPSPSAGFNTLILGLNLRSAGFYYHQDAEIAGLRAKNAPLVPYQPVVTTVLYEAPHTDSGKEVVLWKPCLNWEAKDGIFTAARALQTSQGTVHVQRAGLQRQTKHGVFHMPGRGAREGWRVAITARSMIARIGHQNRPARRTVPACGHYSTTWPRTRQPTLPALVDSCTCGRTVTKPSAESLVAQHAAQQAYTRQLGPEGSWSLSA